MIAYKLYIRHDGDFYHERPYNIVLHEDECEAIKLIIQSLQAVNDSFSTSKDYLNSIKESVSGFLNAYNSDVESYRDEKYDIWFNRKSGVFEFEFDLDNGNQQIMITSYELDFKIENNVVYINEDKNIEY